MARLGKGGMILIWSAFDQFEVDPNRLPGTHKSSLSLQKVRFRYISIFTVYEIHIAETHSFEPLGTQKGFWLKALTPFILSRKL